MIRGLSLQYFSHILNQVPTRLSAERSSQGINSVPNNIYIYIPARLTLFIFLTNSTMESNWQQGKKEEGTRSGSDHMRGWTTACVNSEQTGRGESVCWWFCAWNPPAASPVCAARLFGRTRRYKPSNLSFTVPHVVANSPHDTSKCPLSSPSPPLRPRSNTQSSCLSVHS